MWLDFRRCLPVVGDISANTICRKCSLFIYLKKITPPKDILSELLHQQNRRWEALASYNFMSKSRSFNDEHSQWNNSNCSLITLDRKQLIHSFYGNSRFENSGQSFTSIPIPGFQIPPLLVPISLLPWQSICHKCWNPNPARKSWKWPLRETALTEQL